MVSLIRTGNTVWLMRVVEEYDIKKLGFKSRSMHS